MLPIIVKNYTLYRVDNDPVVSNINNSSSNSYGNRIQIDYQIDHTVMNNLKPMTYGDLFYSSPNAYAIATYESEGELLRALVASKINHDFNTGKYVILPSVRYIFDVKEIRRIKTKSIFNSL